MTSADTAVLRRDLFDETAALQALLGGLRDDQWYLPTPAAGWDIADQIGHLAYFDEAALLSMTDPRRFRREAAELISAGADFPDRIAEQNRGKTGAQTLDWFRGARDALLAGYDRVDPAVRLPWYGPDMGVASSLTARLMETWAHGQDVADTLGVERSPSIRLRHVAHLGIRALPYSYAVNGRPLPVEPIRVALVAPDGDSWAWGPADTQNSVRGTALDFALVVTQRRHLDDTGLVVVGSTAAEWMGIAQAFAGARGPGRPPRRAVLS